MISIGKRPGSIKTKPFLETDEEKAIRKSEEGNIVSVIPVLEVQTTGSYRPYIQGATLKHSMAVYELEAIYSEGGLSGLDSTESTLLEIPGEINDLIAAPSQPDDLVLRIHGLHRDYDMDITLQLEEVRAFCAPIATE